MSIDQLKENPTVKWSWSVKTPSGQEFGVNNVDYESAIAAWNKLRDETTDEVLKSKMASVDRSFGVMGSYGDGYQIQTSATSPRTKGDEIHWCPRRSEGGPGPNIAKDGDRWDAFPNGQRVCSYCGSLHPDDMFALISEHGLAAIEPSTKGYKWYIGRAFAAVNASLGPIKYYRMHDTPQLLEKLKELIDSAKAEGE